LTRWNVQNNIVADKQHVQYNETNINVFKHHYWSGNNEWKLLAYKYEHLEVPTTQGYSLSSVAVTVKKVSFSRLNSSINFHKF